MLIALIVLGLVALMGLLHRQRQNPSPTVTRTMVAVGGLLLLLGVCQYELSRAAARRQLREALPIFDYHEVVGCGLALAANAAVPDGGPMVVITVNQSLTRETKRFTDAEIHGVMHCLNANLSIVQVEQAPPEIFREG